MDKKMEVCFLIIENRKLASFKHTVFWKPFKMSHLKNYKISSCEWKFKLFNLWHKSWRMWHKLWLLWQNPDICDTMTKLWHLWKHFDNILATLWHLWQHCDISDNIVTQMLQNETFWAIFKHYTILSRLPRN